MKKILSAIALFFVFLPVLVSATTRSEYEAYARHAAKVHGVNAEHLVATLKCEAHFNAKAIGDHGESYGLSQIHLPDHPNISSKQALNGFWAIDFAVHEFSIGNAGIWSCYRRLFL
jgi:hypothetical protein